MHIAVLASVYPSFSHARAGYIVLASLLEEFGRAGHRVSLYTACTGNAPDPDALARLEAAGVRHVADLTAETVPDSTPGGLTSDLRTLRRAYLPMHDDDFPRFTEAAASRIRADRPDAALLFWDSSFDLLLPRLGGLRTVGYFARPRTASPLAAIDARPARGLAGLKQSVARRILKHQEARHLQRVRRLDGAVNICALDAAYYSSHGVPCGYLPNTWPDTFGADWRAARERTEASRPRVAVLGNIGNVNATGNGFGIAYLAREVLPVLAPETRAAIEVSICGGGRLAPDVAEMLTAQGARIRGFIDDIDGEVLASRIFLLLNNAGPYTGGYTRVMYAFSSGACLIAHRRLADSMPEVRHGENALLGESGPEIAALIQKAVADKALARRLGEGARQTYESAYRPAVVAQGLLQRMAA